jgi:hypothetical protein
LASVHVPAAGVKTPAAPPLEKVTVPVGFEGVGVEVSVTVAMHEAGEPTGTLAGVHTTAVVVESRVAATT